MSDFMSFSASGATLSGRPPAAVHAPERVALEAEMEMKSLMTRVIFTSRRFLCGPWPLQPHFLIRRWIVQLASDKDHRTRGRHETGLVNAEIGRASCRERV